MFVGSTHLIPSRNHLCPKCQDYALRVRRRLIDRILHPITPVRRYRCMSTACGWVGNLKPGERMPTSRDSESPVLEHASSGSGRS